MFTKFIERSLHEKEFKKDSEASSKIETNCYELEPKKTNTHKQY